MCGWDIIIYQILNETLGVAHSMAEFFFNQLAILCSRGHVLIKGNEGNFE